jgi:transposase-like protein
MKPPEKMLIAVDADALSRVEAKLDALLQMLERSKTTPMPDWVSISEAARINEVSATTIRRWIDLGQIEARGAGKVRRVKVR